MNLASSASKRLGWQWNRSRRSSQKTVKRDRPSTQQAHQTPCPSPSCTCVVCGCENVGKTQLLASLTGRLPVPENFRGSTIACETYRDGDLHWTDTPGIVRESETSATRSAIKQINAADRVMLVTRVDRAAEELPALLRTAAGKLGFVVLTFLDRLPTGNALQTKELSAALGVPVFPVDARHLKLSEANAIRNTANTPAAKLGCFPDAPPTQLPLPTAFHAKRKSSFEKVISSPPVALLLLFLPTILAIIYTNRFADWLYDPLANVLKPTLSSIATWPALPSALIGGDYGLLAMFPFLILYAAPTILVFSTILGVYKSTGLIDRLSHALHPWLRPVGLGGRDLVRVVMGFGCNVPAIVSSRACHRCSREACVSAISFGAACSYQLPATLAVFAAAGMGGMGIVYLAVLALTTLIYLRFTTPKILRLATNTIVAPLSNSLNLPSWRSVGREVSSNLQQFAAMALPVFTLICLVAALLDWLGALTVLSQVLAPALALFNLPGDAASAVILGSIRKDGIAIGLLENGGGALKVSLTTPAQVLTAVYLAGVLLPCLVTVFTMIREMRWEFAAKLCARQTLWAVSFSILIAWCGELIS